MHPTLNYILTRSKLPAAVATYVTSTGSGSSGSSFSFSATSLGQVSQSRIVVVGVSARMSSGGAAGVTSLTIGGTAATQLVQTADTTTGIVAGLYALQVPSGETATIAAGLSGTALACNISVWAVDGARSSTPFTTGSSTSDPGAVSLTFPAYSTVLAVGGSDNAPPNTTWSNATKRFDGAAGGVTHAAADSFFTTAQVGVSVSCDFTTATSPRTVAVVFSP